MTTREKVIVSAYTGYLMCDVTEVHKYIEEKLGRPVWTHELARRDVQEELHEVCREDFLALCKEEELEGQIKIGFA